MYAAAVSLVYLLFLWLEWVALYELWLVVVLCECVCIGFALVLLSSVTGTWEGGEDLLIH